MKKALVVLALLVIAVIVSVPASAHEVLNPTCNSSGNWYGVQNPIPPPQIGWLGAYTVNGVQTEKFAVSYSGDCGHGGTVEWEVQNEAGGTWGDVHNLTNDRIDFTDTNNGSGGTTTWSHPSLNSTDLPNGGASCYYRVVTWDYNGFRSSTAVNVC